MKQFVIVKWLLFASWGLPVWAVPPLPLECGHYLGRGFLDRNAQGHTLLVLQKGSASPVELILLGGDLKGRMERIGTEAVLDFYIPRKIASNHELFVFVKEFVETKQKFPPSGVVQKRKDKCGQRKYAPKS